MGRGRGKGKKQNAIGAREDLGGGEEEKVPVHRRRGRPQKPLKDETEEEPEKMEEEENAENLKSSITNNNDAKNASINHGNGRKRKRSSQVKGSPDSNEENGVGMKTGADAPVRPVGFRQNGSRRKNKPRRAAEVGVECN